MLGGAYAHVPLVPVAWDDDLCSIHGFSANSGSASRGNSLHTHNCKRLRGMTAILMLLLVLYDM